MSKLQRNMVGAPSVSGPASVPDPRAGAFHLVAIGVDEYSHWNWLKTARAGAEELAGLLRDKFGFRPENIRCLKDREATLAGILHLLETVIAALGPEDSLILYFAGHGHIHQLTKSGAWIPSDGKHPEDPAAIATWIKHDQIRELIRACKARHVFVISDSCFAGDFVIEERGGATGFIRKATALVSRQVLAAGGVEPVADSGNGVHSVFTGWLLKVLEDFEGECLSASKLGLLVSEAVGHDSDQQPCFASLSRTGGQPGGEFVFFRNGVVPAGTAPLSGVPRPRRRFPWRRLWQWVAVTVAVVVLGTGVSFWVNQQRERERLRTEEAGRVRRERELKALQQALAPIDALRETRSLAAVDAVEERLSLYLGETTEENRQLIRKRLLELRELVVRRLQEETPPRPEAPSPASRVSATNDAPLALPPAVPPRSRFTPGWTNSLGQRFVAVPATRVLFCVTETSLRDYSRLETNRSVIKRLPLQTDDHPVVNVRWQEATNFAWKLTLKERAEGVLGPRDHYRLPTDREWNLAAGISTNPPPVEPHEQRGNPLARKVERWWSRGQPAIADGNFAGEEFENDRLLKLQPRLPGFRDQFVTTAPVTSLATNAFGLFHIPGNVSEWCQDQDGGRWARGGAWDTSKTDHLAKNHRWIKTTGDGSGSIGFRLVLVPGE